MLTIGQDDQKNDANNDQCQQDANESDYGGYFGESLVLFGLARRLSRRAEHVSSRLSHERTRSKKWWQIV